MKNLFLILFLLGTMASCIYYRAIEFTYTIENKLPYTIEVRYIDNYRAISLPDSSVFISPNTVKDITNNSWRGSNKDRYPDTFSSLTVFYSLKIYRADTLLVKKDLRVRKEWIFSQTNDEKSAYLLIIDQDDLK
jgi:hypothetical protein